MARSARRAAPVRHGPLHGRCPPPAPAVGPGLEGPYRRGTDRPDIAARVPLDLLGLISGLPAGAAQVPWDGPPVTIIEHQAHAAGHAALLIGERVGGAGQVRARIDQDRAYVHALRDAQVPSDPRTGPAATYDWVPGVHARQLAILARRGEPNGTCA